MNSRKEITFNDRLSLIVREMNYSENFQNQFTYSLTDDGKGAIYSNAPVLMSELRQLNKEFRITSIMPAILHDNEVRIGLK